MLKFIILCIALLWIQIIYAIEFKNFPQQQYETQIISWKLKQTSKQTLLSLPQQLLLFKQFKSHYFGTKNLDQSPWSYNYVFKLLEGNQQKNLFLYEASQIEKFDNKKLTLNNNGYGENLQLYDENWTHKIRINMDISQFKDVKYSVNNRAIAIANDWGYYIPTDDPWYLHNNNDNGYPFNMNLISGITIGTPLYIIAETKDKAWKLVITPTMIAWIKSNIQAAVTTEFVDKWSKLADKSLVSIIKPNTSLMNHKKIFITKLLAGTVLPAIPNTMMGVNVFIPIKSIHGNAVITVGWLNHNVIRVMPLPFTIANINFLIDNLISRPYGWGGFLDYNDCSAEMQAIFTTFGYFMPRNSDQQIYTGEVIDLSNKTYQERITYILNNAKAYMTLLYINNHIMLYVGSIKINNLAVILTYQNVWGLTAKNGAIKYLIGKSLYLPILQQYDDIQVKSLLDFKILKLIYLSTPNLNIDMQQIIY